MLRHRQLQRYEDVTDCPGEGAPSLSCSVRQLSSLGWSGRATLRDKAVALETCHRPCILGCPTFDGFLSTVGPRPRAHWTALPISCSVRRVAREIGASVLARACCEPGDGERQCTATGERPEIWAPPYADCLSSTPYRFAADSIRFHAARRSASVTPFT